MVGLETAMYIKFHPLLKEKAEVKEKYIKIFIYFILKSELSKELINEIIDLYVEILQIRHIDVTECMEIKNIRECADYLSNWKCQKLNGLIYKILLIQDIFYYVNASDKCKVDEIYRDICALFYTDLVDENQIIIESIIKTSECSILENWKGCLSRLSNIYEKLISKNCFIVIGLLFLVLFPGFGLIYAGIYSLNKRENYFKVCKKGLANIYILSKQTLYSIRRIRSVRSINVCKQNKDDMFTGTMDSRRDLSKMNIICIPKCKKKNEAFFSKKHYKVLVTATMSAGKSSLINAICGIPINQVANEATTNAIRYIFNKTFNDELIYQAHDKLSLNNSLNEVKSTKESDELYLSLNSRPLEKERIVFVDTPGVNYSEDENHKITTRKEIEKLNYDLLIFVFNVQNLRTTDDYVHLNFIKDVLKDKNIIFVINKIDGIDVETDSMKTIVQNTREFLENIGFSNPCIIPVSSKVGELCKKKQSSILKPKEKYMYSIYEDMFKEYEMNIAKLFDHASTNNELLEMSGLGVLEQEIRRRIYEDNIY